MEISRREKKKGCHPGMLLDLYLLLYQLTILKNCHQLLKFAVIPLVERKKIYSLPYLFIVTNDYPRQDKGLEKRIGL